MKKNKEFSKKAKQIDEILFKQIDRNTLIKKRQHFEDLAVYILDSILKNYPWSACYEPLEHNLYIFNSALEPQHGDWFSVLGIKNVDSFYNTVLTVGTKMIGKNNLPKVGDATQIKQLVLELKTHLSL